MKMIIMLGLVLQASGITLEIVGLFFAYRSFGSVSERWSGFGKKGYSALIPSVREEFKDEGRKFAVQIKIIGIGLFLQLVGLFFS